MPLQQLESREALPADHDTLRALLDVAPLAIVTLDLGGQITRWNVGAERLLGWSTCEMLQPLHPDAAAEADWLRERCGAALHDGRVSTTECRRPRRDGTAVDVAVSVAVTRDANGRPQGFVGIYVEPTKHAHVKRDETLNALAAGIALEINTPSQYVGDNLRFLSDAWVRSVQLFTALGRLRMLLDSDADCATMRAEIAAACGVADHADFDFLMEEVPKAIAQSIDGVQRVGKIVRAMKEFSPAQRDVRKLTDLNEAVTNTTIVAATELRDVADLVTDLDPELPHVWCLPGDINEVILVLLMNAAKAVGAAAAERPGVGTITARTRYTGDWVELQISDTGIGIPEALQPHVFDPFYEGFDNGKPIGHSLAMAYMTIVKQHRGGMWFETKRGVGTTVFVQLPMRKRERRQAPEVE